MPDLSPQILPRLKNRQLPGLNTFPGAVLPAYEGFSLCNLPSSACQWLGVPAPGIPLDASLSGEFEGVYDHVIVLLMDALGYNLVHSWLQQPGTLPGCREAWQRLAENSTQAVLTSVVPSTTTSALTSLWTAVAPAAHGMLGYELWLKEYGVIANMIKHSPAFFTGEGGSIRQAGFEPGTFLPVPALGTHLGAAGISAYSFQHISIASSGLSAMYLKDATSLGYATTSDLWVSLGQLLTGRPRERNYIYLYYGEIDTLGHRYGPLDERIWMELDGFVLQMDRFFTWIKKKNIGRTLLVLTADHGLAATPPDAKYDLRNYPRIMQCLSMPPSGESRFAYLYIHPGLEKSLIEEIRVVFGDDFSLLSSQSALSAGLFGAGLPYGRSAGRLGDAIACAQGDAYLWWSSKENSMRGKHGGLSGDEMLIPVWIKQL